jgi:hypothetical protein
MIRICYSSKPYVELYLEGSQQELVELRQQIISLHRGDLLVDAERDFDPTPFESVLNRVHFIVSDSLLEITVIGSELRIQGRKELLECFANNLPWDAEHTNDQVNYHHHFDRVWYPDSFSEHSLEIVLALKR